MRRVKRIELAAEEKNALAKRQRRVNVLSSIGQLNVDKEWRSGRQTKAVKHALTALRTMMGSRQRCMYCLDSHGTDIEHFWPKQKFPNRLYVWLNLLLCCTECGRFKGEQFPLIDGEPLLIDPTVEQPWDYLDFDPVTGNIVARFILHLNDSSPKGKATVNVLQLDRREALAAGYQRTYRHLCEIVRQYLQKQDLPIREFVHLLQDNDDHGLMGWCFCGMGQTEPLFVELRNNHPLAWADCVQICR